MLEALGSSMPFRRCAAGFWSQCRRGAVLQAQYNLPADRPARSTAIKPAAPMLNQAFTE